jgi:hypothetical protein
VKENSFKGMASQLLLKELQINRDKKPLTVKISKNPKHISWGVT